MSNITVLADTDQFTMEHWHDDKILYITLRGTHDAEVGKRYLKAYYGFMNSLPDGHMMRIIGDATHLKGITRDARKDYNELAKHPNSGKTAFFGMNSFARALISFIAFAGGKSHILKMCTNREEALEWVKA